MKKILLLLLVLISFLAKAQQPDSIRALIITAHPDDESAFAVTVYKITHELNGLVDIAIITNGEGGYKYSLLAESIYHLKLTDEAVGRKYLPTIRKKEMMNAGSILGIHNYYFLDQLDNHYTLDVDSVFKDVWNIPLIKKRLTDIITTSNYDVIFCLLPTEGTHGHHKGATILALQVVNELNSKKPIVLGAMPVNKEDTIKTVFHGLKNYPITTISDSVPIATIDRNVSFGFRNQLNYKIIVSWEAVEHKSQGTIQSNLARNDLENFWYFDANGAAGRGIVNKIFKVLQEKKPE
jgi:LmbE family N-acetylglucosaminyl deacetylase